MALSLKEKLNAQMAENQKGYEESIDNKEKAENKKDLAHNPQTKKAPETNPVEKTPESTQEKPTKNASSKEKKTIAGQIDVKEKPQDKVLNKESTHANSTKISFSEWKTRVMHAAGEPDPEKKRIYKSIVVGVDNWEYVDEKAKELTDASRKFTHNEYMELLIKDAVSKFNGLNDEERAEARVMGYDSKKHINKAKLVGMEEKYWVALDQLRMAYRGMTKCDLLNYIIDEDVAKAHPHREEVTKITL